MTKNVYSILSAISADRFATAASSMEHALSFVISLDSHSSTIYCLKTNHGTPKPLQEIVLLLAVSRLYWHEVRREEVMHVVEITTGLGSHPAAGNVELGGVTGEAARGSTLACRLPRRPTTSSIGPAARSSSCHLSPEDHLSRQCMPLSIAT